MKKLRMIVTSVIVLAIVGSLFAFKVKKVASFCVLDAAASGANCTTYISDKMIVITGGTQYKHGPDWDGDPVACTATNNGLCTDGPINLDTN